MGVFVVEPIVVEPFVVEPFVVEPWASLFKKSDNFLAGNRHRSRR